MSKHEDGEVVEETNLTETVEKLVNKKEPKTLAAVMESLGDKSTKSRDKITKKEKKVVMKAAIKIAEYAAEHTDIGEDSVAMYSKRLVENITDALKKTA